MNSAGKEHTFNRGVMPNTDFTYEEFETFLASYYLTFKPLENGDEQDRVVFDSATAALNQLAQNQGVRLPVSVIYHCKSTEDEREFGPFTTPGMLLDSFRAFSSDFGVGIEPQTPDFEQRMILGRAVLSTLDKHGVIKAGFEKIGEKRYPVKIESKNAEFMSKPLQNLLKTNQ